MSPHFPGKDINFHSNTKLISCLRNPAYNCIMEMRYKNLFENKAKVIKPIDLRIQTLLNEIKINPKIIHNTILPKPAPWTINQPIVKLELTKLSKTKTPPSLSKRNSSTSKTTSQITTTSIQMDPNREWKLVVLLSSKTKNC